MAAYQRKQNENRGPAPVNSNLPVVPEPDTKKIKWKHSIEPLGRNTSPLPELPDELKRKQDDLDMGSGHKLIPLPPKCNVKTGFRRGVRPASSHGKKQFYDQEIEDIIDSGLSDPTEILEIVRNHPNVGFFYMKTAAPRSSINYNPYNVK